MTLLLEDRALLKAFRAGERWALERVYFHYVGEIGTILRQGFSTEGHRVLGVRDREMQAELVQEVFLKAFSKNARLGYDGLRPYRPYLARIAKNLLIDRLRRQKPELLVSEVEEIDHALLEPQIPPEDALHWARLREATVAHLAQRPEQERRFVELRFEQGLSQRDAAAALGIRRSQARKLEAEVLRVLERALKKKQLF